MSASLRAKTLANVGYNALAKGMMFIFQAIASIVLARNLVSSDYGIVGFAMIFINFLSQFNDLGINSAVIQKPGLDEKALYTGFTIKAILGLSIFTASFLFSPMSKLIFDDHAVVDVIKLLSLTFIINIFAFLPSTLLTRELNYKKLVISQVGFAIANSGISIILALNGFKYWSIVVSNLCATIVFVFLINIINPVKIKFFFNKKNAYELISFGSNLFFSGLIVFAIFNIDNFIIGAVKGSKMLGYYAIAFNWGSMICGILSAVVLSVLFPTFSRIQQDKERLKNAYLKILTYISFIGVLANLSLLVISKEFLFFILGHGTDKWMPAIAAFRVLCLYGIIRAFLEPVGSVMLAIRETRQLLVAQVIIAILEIGLLYPALIYFNIEGVAILVTVSYVSAYLILFRVLRQKIKLRFNEWIKPILPVITAGFIAIIAIYPAEYIISFSFIGAMQKLLLFVLLYCSIYGVLTRWRILKEIKDAIVELRYQPKQV